MGGGSVIQDVELLLILWKIGEKVVDRQFRVQQGCDVCQESFWKPPRPNVSATCFLFGGGLVSPSKGRMTED